MNASRCFDLTERPDRAAVGLPDGRSSVTYQRDDHKPFRVEVRLPDLMALAVEARLVTFDALDQPEPDTAAPTTMDIHHYAVTAEEGRDHLVEVAGRFGLDAAPIHKWYDSASGPPPADAATVRTPWFGTDVGYLRMEIQASYTWPVDTPESDQTVVHYLLTWTPVAKSS